MSVRYHETDAIVLDTLAHGESDLILTLFCRTGGRLTAIAKGARNSKRRFVNKLEIFSLLQVVLRYRQGATLALLEQADLDSCFLRLRQDASYYVAASVIREFLLLATHEGQEDAEIFQLLHWSLSELDAGRNHLRLVMFFLIRLFTALGYKPAFDRCVSCGTASLSQGCRGFSLAAGGPVCGTCPGWATRQLLPCTPATAALLVVAQDLPLPELAGLPTSTTQLYEGLRILHQYGCHLLQREITSWRLLRETRYKVPAAG